MKKYYPVPFSPIEFMTGSFDRSKMCSEWESVYSYLELLLTTCPGEHKFDKNWGCKIWERDFELITSATLWESQCATIIIEMIKNYEHRLEEVAVNVKIIEISKIDNDILPKTVKRKMKIKIHAVFTSTGEECDFEYNLYLGPIGSE